jgi:hypothetical protein
MSILNIKSFKGFAGVSMGNASWHDLVIRAARSIPPIARLHDDRNAWAVKSAAVQGAQTAANPKRA